MTTVHEKCFKALYRFCVTLDADLPHSAHTICVSSSKLERLCGLLGPNNYTRLVISDGVDHEIVLVESSYGDVVIHRAQEGTRALEWRCGSQVTFEWTPANMADQADLAEKAVEEEIEEEKCDFDGVLCIGNYDYKVEDGLIVSRKCVRKLPNACINNASLNFDEDGCIVEAAEGEKVAILSHQIKCT